MSTRFDRVIPILAAPLLFALACSSGPADPGDRSPGGPPAGAVIVDGIEYDASLEVMESFPVQIAGTVTLTNRTDERKTITFADGCVALLRAYDGGTRIWDQAEQVACTMATVPVELAAGESEQFRTPTSSAYDVLDDEWPDGEYAIAVYLRPIGEEVEVDAGTVELEIPR
ncbi:MAG: BsuPI-related putative proteinase inhibitor [Gemmatimonadota bacterium]|nr:BsuPI-related putative proteinase inhibitor [Gemmatimonadota bacterium]